MHPDLVISITNERECLILDLVISVADERGVLITDHLIL